jgi:cytochrome c peroxidase
MNKAIADRRVQWIVVKGALLACLILFAAVVRAQGPVSLSQVPVPESLNIARFVSDKNAAIRLGKALFWDMQTGSDGMTACGTCHFHAGADNRARNTLHPGANGVYDGGSRPNTQLKLSDFPFVRFADPDNRFSARTVRDDRVGSQGVTKSQLFGVTPGLDVDRGLSIHDAFFFHNGRSVRQVTGRNTPTVINAVFNFANLLDGGANDFFNGVNPRGIMDTQARIHLNVNGVLQPTSLTGNLQVNPLALNNASIASQATGPPLVSSEMSWIGRSWPQIGRKMLPMRPLAKQEVHPQDSALSGLRHASGKGLATTYDAMIRAAFRPEFWNSAQLVNGFTQLEQNFSLFFGLAVQQYAATLVADQTPFDRWLEGDPTALSESADRGRGIFFSGGAGCVNCHIGPELTAASVSGATAPGEAGLIELMSMGDGNLANYDIGYYNIGVAPTAADLGRGGTIPILMADGRPMPLSFTRQHFEGAANLGFTPIAQPGCVNGFLGDPPVICPPSNDTVTRTAVDGAFKTPGLRNVELTGPYMHNGSMATLRQVVDFYTRGGNFHEENIADLDPFINGIGQLRGDEQRKTDLVNFLLALTDERVRQESAPFDHPQIFVPTGHREQFSGNPKSTRVLEDNVLDWPAVGAAGRAAQGLPPLRPFLTDDLDGAALANFHYQP